MTKCHYPFETVCFN